MLWTRYQQAPQLRQTPSLCSIRICSKKIGKKSCKGGQRKDPWWKRRINEDIKRIRRDLNILQRELKEQVRNRAKIEELENKYHFKSKKFNTVIEGLKQRLVA